MQAVSTRIPGRIRDRVVAATAPRARGGDLTSEKGAGHWLHSGRSMHAMPRSRLHYVCTGHGKRYTQARIEEPRPPGSRPGGTARATPVESRQC